VTKDSVKSGAALRELTAQGVTAAPALSCAGRVVAEGPAVEGCAQPERDSSLACSGRHSAGCECTCSLLTLALALALTPTGAAMGVVRVGLLAGLGVLPRQSGVAPPRKVREQRRAHTRPSQGAPVLESFGLVLPDPAAVCSQSRGSGPSALRLRWNHAPLMIPRRLVKASSALQEAPRVSPQPPHPPSPTA
jgi:hypothetical protein